MSTKVKIARIQEPQIETIEIPDECPNCGSDLREPDSLRESGYVAYSAHQHVDPEMPDDLHGEDEFEHDFADSMRTGLECVECGHDFTANHG